MYLVSLLGQAASGLSGEGVGVGILTLFSLILSTGDPGGTLGGLYWEPEDKDGIGGTKGA
jgi:hypothetical protein